MSVVNRQLSWPIMLCTEPQDDGDTILFSTGRIVARITLGDQPRFIEKIVVYDTCRIPDLLVFPM